MEEQQLKIELGAWPCPANRDVEIVLPPGGAYTNLGDITIDESIWGKTLTFRMGFTSLESKKTIWSDKVKLRVLPAVKK